MSFICKVIYRPGKGEGMQRTSETRYQSSVLYCWTLLATKVRRKII